MNRKKNVNEMILRILKIFGICFAVMVALVGIMIGILAVSGKFKTPVIFANTIFFEEDQILISFDPNNLEDLEDFTFTVQADPNNTNQNDMVLIVESGSEVISIPTTASIWDEIPITVLMNSDSSNTVGGISTIIARANDNMLQTTIPLTILVDKAITLEDLLINYQEDDEITISEGESLTIEKLFDTDPFGDSYDIEKISMYSMDGETQYANIIDGVLYGYASTESAKEDLYLEISVYPTYYNQFLAENAEGFTEADKKEYMITKKIKVNVEIVEIEEITVSTEDINLYLYDNDGIYLSINDSTNPDTFDLNIELLQNGRPVDGIYTGITLDIKVGTESVKNLFNFYIKDNIYNALDTTQFVSDTVLYLKANKDLSSNSVVLEVSYNGIVETITINVLVISPTDIIINNGEGISINIESTNPITYFSLSSEVLPSNATYQKIYYFLQLTDTSSIDAFGIIDTITYNGSPLIGYYDGSEYVYDKLRINSNLITSVISDFTIMAVVVETNINNEFVDYKSTIDLYGTSLIVPGISTLQLEDYGTKVLKSATNRASLNYYLEDVSVNIGTLNSDLFTAYESYDEVYKNTEDVVLYIEDGNLYNTLYNVLAGKDYTLTAVLRYTKTNNLVETETTKTYVTFGDIIYIKNIDGIFTGVYVEIELIEPLPSGTYLSFEFNHNDQIVVSTNNIIIKNDEATDIIVSDILIDGKITITETFNSTESISTFTILTAYFDTISEETKYAETTIVNGNAFLSSYITIYPTDIPISTYTLSSTNNSVLEIDSSNQITIKNITDSVQIIVTANSGSSVDPLVLEIEIKSTSTFSTNYTTTTSLSGNSYQLVELSVDKELYSSDYFSYTGNDLVSYQADSLRVVDKIDNNMSDKITFNETLLTIKVNADLVSSLYIEFRLSAPFVSDLILRICIYSSFEVLQDSKNFTSDNSLVVNEGSIGEYTIVASYDVYDNSAWAIYDITEDTALDIYSNEDIDDITELNITVKYKVINTLVYGTSDDTNYINNTKFYDIGEGHIILYFTAIDNIEDQYISILLSFGENSDVSFEYIVYVNPQYTVHYLEGKEYSTNLYLGDSYNHTDYVEKITYYSDIVYNYETNSTVSELQSGNLTYESVFNISEDGSTIIAVSLATDSIVKLIFGDNIVVNIASVNIINPFDLELVEDEDYEFEALGVYSVEDFVSIIKLYEDADLDEMEVYFSNIDNSIFTVTNDKKYINISENLYTSTAVYITFSYTVDSVKFETTFKIIFTANLPDDFIIKSEITLYAGNVLSIFSNLNIELEYDQIDAEGTITKLVDDELIYTDNGNYTIAIFDKNGNAVSYTDNGLFTLSGTDTLTALSDVGNGGFVYIQITTKLGYFDSERTTYKVSFVNPITLSINNLTDLSIMTDSFDEEIYYEPAMLDDYLWIYGSYSDSTVFETTTDNTVDKLSLKDNGYSRLSINMLEGFESSININDITFSYSGTSELQVLYSYVTANSYTPIGVFVKIISVTEDELGCLTIEYEGATADFWIHIVKDITASITPDYNSEDVDLVYIENDDLFELNDYFDSLIKSSTTYAFKFSITGAIYNGEAIYNVGNNLYGSQVQMITSYSSDLKDDTYKLEFVDVYGTLYLDVLVYNQDVILCIYKFCFISNLYVSASDSTTDLSNAKKVSTFTGFEYNSNSTNVEQPYFYYINSANQWTIQSDDIVITDNLSSVFSYYNGMFTVRYTDTELTGYITYTLKCLINNNELTLTFPVTIKANATSYFDLENYTEGVYNTIYTYVDGTLHIVGGTDIYSGGESFLTYLKYNDNGVESDVNIITAEILYANGNTVNNASQSNYITVERDLITNDISFLNFVEQYSDITISLYLETDFGFSQILTIILKANISDTPTYNSAEVNNGSLVTKSIVVDANSAEDIADGNFRSITLSDYINIYDLLGAKISYSRISISAVITIDGVNTSNYSWSEYVVLLEDNYCFINNVSDMYINFKLTVDGYSIEYNLYVLVKANYYINIVYPVVDTDTSLSSYINTEYVDSSKSITINSSVSDYLFSNVVSDSSISATVFDGLGINNNRLQYYATNDDNSLSYSQVNGSSLVSTSSANAFDISSSSDYISVGTNKNNGFIDSGTISFTLPDNAVSNITGYITITNGTGLQLEYSFTIVLTNSSHVGLDSVSNDGEQIIIYSEDMYNDYTILITNLNSADSSINSFVYFDTDNTTNLQVGLEMFVINSSGLKADVYDSDYISGNYIQLIQSNQKDFEDWKYTLYFRNYSGYLGCVNIVFPPIEFSTNYSLTSTNYDVQYYQSSFNINDNYSVFVDTDKYGDITYITEYYVKESASISSMTVSTLGLVEISGSSTDTTYETIVIKITIQDIIFEFEYNLQINDHRVLLVNGSNNLSSSYTILMSDLYSQETSSSMSDTQLSLIDLYDEDNYENNLFYFSYTHIKDYTQNYNAQIDFKVSNTELYALNPYYTSYSDLNSLGNIVSLYYDSIDKSTKMIINFEPLEEVIIPLTVHIYGDTTDVLAIFNIVIKPSVTVYSANGNYGDNLFVQAGNYSGYSDEYIVISDGEETTFNLTDNTFYLLYTTNGSAAVDLTTVNNSYVSNIDYQVFSTTTSQSSMLESWNTDTYSSAFSDIYLTDSDQTEIGSYETDAIILRNLPKVSDMRILSIRITILLPVYTLDGDGANNNYYYVYYYYLLNDNIEITLTDSNTAYVDFDDDDYYVNDLTTSLEITLFSNNTTSSFLSLNGSVLSDADYKSLTVETLYDYDYDFSIVDSNGADIATGTGNGLASLRITPKDNITTLFDTTTTFYIIIKGSGGSELWSGYITLDFYNTLRLNAEDNTIALAEIGYSFTGYTNSSVNQVVDYSVEIEDDNILSDYMGEIDDVSVNYYLGNESTGTFTLGDATIITDGTNAIEVDGAFLYKIVLTHYYSNDGNDNYLYTQTREMLVLAVPNLTLISVNTSGDYTYINPTIDDELESNSYDVYRFINVITISETDNTYTSEPFYMREDEEDERTGILLLDVQKSDTNNIGEYNYSPTFEYEYSLGDIVGITRGEYVETNLIVSDYNGALQDKTIKLRVYNNLTNINFNNTGTESGTIYENSGGIDTTTLVGFINYEDTEDTDAVVTYYMSPFKSGVNYYQISFKFQTGYTFDNSYGKGFTITYKDESTGSPYETIIDSDGTVTLLILDNVDCEGMTINYSLIKS